MQLRAYNEKQQIIFAHQAQKHIDYFCLECKGALRLRSGLHRQKHFYHLAPTKNCRQNGKSMEHLQNQCFIKSRLGEGCLLEHPFPQLGRIADCVWPEKKIVFEVQCSPITQEEVSQRNKDYASQGYQVVWILHDERFSQRRLCAAELWLVDHPHYFTNINALGKGFVYDQVDVIEKATRHSLLKRTPVSIEKPTAHDLSSLPAPLRKRHSAWQIAFENDWFQRSQEPEYRELLDGFFQEAPTSFLAHLKQALSWLWHTCVKYPYHVVFDFLLERACR